MPEKMLLTNEKLNYVVAKKKWFGQLEVVWASTTEHQQSFIEHPKNNSVSTILFEQYKLPAKSRSFDLARHF